MIPLKGFPRVISRETALADDIYVVDQLVTGTATVTLTDDGTGSDTFVVLGLYASTVEINLAWTTVSGVPTSAESLYFNPTNVGHRLIVNGVIENAIGSNGQDFIQGNSLANRLFGDALSIGAGLNDTLWAGSGNDSVFGGSGDDGIQGDGGDDALFGDDGTDTISGGSGIDTIEGGAGADVLAGGSSTGDTLSYVSSNAGVQIRIEFGSMTTGTGGAAAGDQIQGFFNVAGSVFNDRIEDIVKGTLAFGYSDNAFFGGAGRDRLILGGGDDQGFGGGGNDFLAGELGSDALFGGANNDELRGGRGQDVASGGTGSDRFVFRAASDSTVSPANRDTITDFSTAQGDIIDLSAIDAEAGVAGNQAFHFITTAFQGNVGELRARVSGGDLIVVGDINGDLVADFAILLQGVASITGLDFNL